MGTTRKRPSSDAITAVKEETLEQCPDCGNPVNPSASTRERIIIDMQLPQKPEVTKHMIHQYWCGTCGAMKEKAVVDALPGFVTGLKTVMYSAYQHYHLGLSISKIIDTLSIHGIRITAGALVGGWHGLAQLFRPLYEEIGDIIRSCQDAVYADETSARQNGKKHWLWSFSTKKEALFVIRKSRGGNIVREILGTVFPGILVTDFWKPYLAVRAFLRQWCVAHLLREFKKIEYARSDLPDEYWLFRKKVKRLFHDALRESKKKTPITDRQAAYRRFLKRLDEITAGVYHDSDVLRLVKRLKKYRDGFFTFVVKDVDATNNHAERIIRYAVIMRKTSFHTMSEKGSETMSVLMSVFKTLELRNADVFQEALALAQKAIAYRKLSKNHLAA